MVALPAVWFPYRGAVGVFPSPTGPKGEQVFGSPMKRVWQASPEEGAGSEDQLQHTPDYLRTRLARHGLANV
jgi:hypothetical protein